MNAGGITRRRLLGVATACGAIAAAPCAGSFAAEAARPGGGGDHGLVQPSIPMPGLALTLQDGTRTTLAALTQGHTTAIQIMFTGCTTICPLGAATFAQVQDLLPDQVHRGIVLLSIDIAPGGERPAALGAWLHRFGARAGWIAASPGLDGIDTVRQLFDQGRNFSENHSDRVHIVNRSGALVWRSYELPSAEDIAVLLTHV